MASLIGRGGSSTLTTSDQVIYDSSTDGPCNEFTVANDDATNDALVRLPAIHGANNWYPIKPGKEKSFIITNGGGIGIIYGKSSASTVAVHGGPTALKG